MTPTDQARALEPALAALAADSIAIRSPCSVRTRRRSSSARFSRRRAPIDLRLVATGELLPMTKRGCRGDLRGPSAVGRDGQDGLEADRRTGRRGRVAFPTTGSASPTRAITSSRSTIRTATAACSPISICTCSAKARITARSRSSARTGSRSGRPTGVHFAVWAPNADRVSVDRRLQRLGRPRAPDAAARRRPASGRSSFPISPTARSTSSRSGRRTGAILQEDRSVRRRVRGAAAVGVGRARHLAATRGTTHAWMARAAGSTARGSIGRCRSTKCISDRGRACPRKATAS